jgi:hypothetical protein
MTGDTVAREISSVASAVTLLSDFRLAALKKTAEIILHPSVKDERYRADSFSHIAALLSTALDFLRVAEEALIGQDARRIARENQFEARRASDSSDVPTQRQRDSRRGAPT